MKHKFPASKSDQKLLEELEEHINKQDYTIAIEKIGLRLNSGFDLTVPREVALKAELAGLLCDIGEEGKILDAAQKAYEIFIQNHDVFRKVIQEYSLHYQLGNALSSIFKIENRNTKGELVIKPSTIEMLVKAKDYYWKAYKKSPEVESKNSLLTNLGNALSTSCRVIEAFQLYDSILKENPWFGMAHVNRSDLFEWLKTLSGVWSWNMLAQLVEGYDFALSDPAVPRYIKDKIGKKKAFWEKILQEHGVTNEKRKEHEEQTQRESAQHSQYRKFCIKSYLTLNEHAIYCSCIGAEADTLTISHHAMTVGGSFIPEMERVLNRIKAEFALARYLYFQFLQAGSLVIEAENEVKYLNLFNGERIGLVSEMLRTSFRLCFGVLDKIARGVCDLFELANQEENVYFESFWNPPHDKARWEKINSIDNFSLVALYSIATDLNMRKGEWGEFKIWRNALEHGMLILSNIPEQAHLFPVEKVVLVDPVEFQRKSLLLLQITRSAIFSFVFCVRSEGSKVLKDQPQITIPIDLKFL